MSITFYAGSGSPFVWRVWLALEHKALPYDLKMLSFSAGDTRQPEFVKLNPRHKVPVIIDGDFVLYESTAIVEYLDEKYPDSGRGLLFPGEAKQRALIRRLVAECDSAIFPALQPISRQLFFTSPDEQSDTEINKGRQALVDELAVVEEQISGDYAAGPLSAADYTLYPLIALLPRLDLKKPGLNVSAAMGPKTLAWKARMEALPYLGKTVPPHWK